MSRFNSQNKPQMKLNGQNISLTERFTDFSKYKMSEAIRDAMEIADRVWTTYLSRVLERWEENPFEGDLCINDPNLKEAFKAKGYLGLSKEEILQAAEKHLEKLVIA